MLKNIIETQRCTLTPLNEKDRGNVFCLYQNRETRQFLGGIVADEKVFDGVFDKILQSRDGLNWAIRLQETKEFIGMANIDLHHDKKEQEVSYQLLPKYWRKGYAYEALQALFAYASETIKLRSVIAETQEANIASRKLLEKLGMTSIKTLTRFEEKQVIYQKTFDF